MKMKKGKMYMYISRKKVYGVTWIMIGYICMVWYGVGRWVIYMNSPPREGIGDGMALKEAPQNQNQFDEKLDALSSKIL